MRLKPACARRALSAAILAGLAAAALAAGEPAPAAPASPELLGILEQALGYERDEVGSAALRGYESLGPRALAAQEGLAARVRKAATLKEALPYARAFARLGDGVLPAVKKMVEARETKPLMAIAQAAAERGFYTQEVLKVLTSYPEPDVSLVAENGLGGAGGEGKAPGYVKAGLGQDSKTRLATLRSLYGDKLTEPYREYLLAALKDPYAEVRAEAAGKLGDLKTTSPRTVEALGQLFLEDPDQTVRSAAANALGKSGAPAVGWLIRGLQDKDGLTRQMAIRAVGHIGPAAAEALPLLRELADQEEAVAKVYAIRAVADISGDQAAATERYLVLLHQEEKAKQLREQGAAKLRAGHQGKPKEFEEWARIRSEEKGALEELCRIGPPIAEKVVPILREMILSSDIVGKPGKGQRLGDWGAEGTNALPDFGRAAAPVLIELYLHPQEVFGLYVPNALSFCDRYRVEILAEFARHKEPKAQLFAAKELGKRGGPLKDETAVAQALLQSADKDVRLQALEALVQRDPRDLAPLGGAIDALMQDPDPAVQKAASALVRRDKLAPSGAAPGVADGLKAADPQTRLNTALGLARQGLCPDAAALVLDEALRNRKLRPEDQRVALRGLSAAARRPPPVRATILACARDPKAERETIEAAVGALAAWEETPAAREKLLVECLGEESFHLRGAAARELGKLGPGVLPRLTALAKDPRTDVKARGVLSEAFAAVGAPALPPLVALLSDAAGRGVASAALPKVEGAAEAVTPLLKSGDERAVEEALYVLLRMGRSARGAAPAVRELHENGPAGLRGQALRTWAYVSPEDPALRPAVLKALDAAEGELRAAGAGVAADLRIESAKIIPVLAERLRTAKTRKEQMEVVTTLTRFGEEALPHLVRAAESEDPEVSLIVWHNWGWHSLAALPALGKFIQCANANVRAQAREKLRQHAPLCVIPLRAALGNADPEVRKLAREELERLGWVAKPALEGK